MSVTEEQRKENMKVMNLYMAIVIGIFSALLFTYTCAIMNDYGCEFLDALTKIPQYWESFGVRGNYTFSSFVIGLLAGGFIGVVAYFFLALDTEKNYSYKKGAVSGTAKFMDKNDLKDYYKRYSVPDSEKILLTKNFYRPANDRIIKGNNNILIVGGAGSGKSRFFMKPNILQMIGSYVITDPSGELLSELGHFLQENGYKIKVFNIEDMEHSNCYNPLHYIRTEADVNKIIDLFIKNTQSGAKEDFWVKAERMLYAACICYLKGLGGSIPQDVSKQTFAEIVDLTNKSNVDESGKQEIVSECDKIFETLPKNCLANKYYHAFKQAAGKTLKSIIISCLVRLQPFMTSEVANLTKMDELELEKIGDEKTALFIITPQADRTYSFLAAMLYTQIFDTLYKIGNRRKQEVGSERFQYAIRCYMDEFANIGDIPEFDEKLATMRKYNISAAVILQDLSQIEAIYEKSYKSLRGNCAVQMFLGSPEDETLKHFSGKLGSTTVTSKNRSINTKSSGKSFSETKRELMTADELSTMSYGEAIVFLQNERPVKDKKYDLKDHPNYKDTYEGSGENPTYAFKYRDNPYYMPSKKDNVGSVVDAVARQSFDGGISNPISPKMRAPIFDVEKQVIEKEKEGEIFSQKMDELLEGAIKCVSDKDMRSPVFISVLTAKMSDIRKMATMLAMQVPVDVILITAGSEKDIFEGFAASGKNINNLHQVLKKSDIPLCVECSEKAIYLKLKKDAYGNFCTDITTELTRLEKK